MKNGTAIWRSHYILFISKENNSHSRPQINKKKVADRHRLTTLQTKQILYDFYTCDYKLGVVVVVLVIVFSFMISGAKLERKNEVRNT